MYLPVLRPHAAGNYAVQRTARELLVDALLRWRDAPWGGFVLLPVHDEIIAMVPEADGPAATAAPVECMETTFEGVPIVAEADQPSQFWADAAYPPLIVSGDPLSGMSRSSQNKHQFQRVRVRGDTRRRGHLPCQRRTGRR